MLINFILVSLNSIILSVIYLMKYENAQLYFAKVKLCERFLTN